MEIGKSGQRPEPSLKIKGFDIYEGALSPAEQLDILEDIRTVLHEAPLHQPMTRWGKPLSVKMSAAGDYGWTSDRRGYRYETLTPQGNAWPAIPDSVHRVWELFSGCQRAPECCLINYYKPDARMGLHQDRDEADFTCPVVSVSLGDDALFRIGNPTKGGKTQSLWLRSGDVVVMGGEARLSYHGIDRIAAGTSPLMPKGGRVNLTLRVVT